MLTQTTAMQLILKELLPSLTKAGFQAAKQHSTPDVALFDNSETTLRIALVDDRVALEFAQGTPEETQDGDEFARLSLALLELNQATERDCKYIAADFAEEITKKFCKRQKGQPLAPGKKMPKSISKTAIKNGDAYYDALAFANSFTGIYPELRADFKANYEKYGGFLAEEFFQSVGNQAIMETIRSNDKTQMKRLFNLLNDVYENGVNEAQSLVVVTILGSLENNTELLLRCTDYMSADLAPVVIRVNQYLYSNAGKRAQKRLANPPAYRPKKEKKPGIFQQLMSGGGGGGLPGM